MRGLILACLLLEASAASAATWEEVRTLFETRCVLCHSGEHAPLGLQLDTHAGLMTGSEYGSVINLNEPDESPLLLRVTGAAKPRMPLDGPPWLDAAEVAMLRDWIEAGAAGPGAETVAVGADDVDPYADGAITYKDVSRIFKQRCIECHSSNSKVGAPPEGLVLSTMDDILAGGDRIVVIPGQPAASELLRRVEGRAAPRMPLDGPPWLDADEIALLRAWIEGGAMDDTLTPAAVPVGARVRVRGVVTGPNEIDGAGFIVSDETRIDDLPREGEEAELRARVGSGGTLLAERLRRR